MNSFFNKTITIKRRTNTGTDFHPVYTWSTLSSVKGAKDLLTERRVIRDAGGNILADFIFYFNYTDILVSDIILCDDEYFTIYSIFNPMGKNKHLEIKALKAKDGQY